MLFYGIYFRKWDAYGKWRNNPKFQGSFGNQNKLECQNIVASGNERSRDGWIDPLLLKIAEQTFQLNPRWQPLQWAKLKWLAQWWFSFISPNKEKQNECQYQTVGCKKRNISLINWLLMLPVTSFAKPWTMIAEDCTHISCHCRN